MSPPKKEKKKKINSTKIGTKWNYVSYLTGGSESIDLAMDS